MKQDRIDSINRAFAHHVSTGAARAASYRPETGHWLVDLPCVGCDTYNDVAAKGLCAGLASAEKRRLGVDLAWNHPLVVVMLERACAIQAEADRLAECEIWPDTTTEHDWEHLEAVAATIREDIAIVTGEDLARTRVRFASYLTMWKAEHIATADMDEAELDALQHDPGYFDPAYLDADAPWGK